MESFVEGFTKDCEDSIRGPSIWENAVVLEDNIPSIQYFELKKSHFNITRNFHSLCLRGDGDLSLSWISKPRDLR